MARRLLGGVLSAVLVVACGSGNSAQSKGTLDGAGGANGGSVNGGGANGGSTSVGGTNGGGTNGGGGGSGAGQGGQASGGEGGASADAGPAVVLNPPTKNSLLVAGDVTLVGVTSDYYAVYSTKDKSIFAVPLVGGAPIPIATNAFALVGGRTVLAITQQANENTLMTWTSTSGVHTLGGRIWSPYGVSFDDTGERIVLTDSTNEWFGLDIALTHSVSLGITHDGGTCTGGAQFAGGRFISVICSYTSGGTVKSWDGSWRDTTLFDGTQYGISAVGGLTVTNALGGRVYAMVEISPAVEYLEWVPVKGGSPTIISKDVYQYLVSPDGTLAYFTNVLGNPLYVSDTTNPAPVTLVAGPTSGNGDDGFFSPDNKHLLYQDVDTARLTGVPGGPDIKLGINSRLLDRGFTQDSKFALFVAGSSYVAWEVSTGTQVAFSPTDLYPTYPEVYAVHGSAILFNDATDARVVYRDLSSPAAATIIAEGVDFGSVFQQGVAVTPARDAFAYAVTTGTTPHGVYGAPVP